MSKGFSEKLKEIKGEDIKAVVKRLGMYRCNGRRIKHIVLDEVSDIDFDKLGKLMKLKKFNLYR